MILLKHMLSSFPFILFSLAAVNPDVYTGSSSLAPTCVSQVSCLLSETSDSRQGWHDQRAGPCWTGQPSALWRDRHVAVIYLWQPVRAGESHQAALAPPPCHPTWLQTEGKLWILNLAPRLLYSPPTLTASTFSSLSVKSDAGSVIVSPCIRYSNWMLWKGDSVQGPLVASPQDKCTPAGQRRRQVQEDEMQTCQMT